MSFLRDRNPSESALVQNSSNTLSRQEKLAPSPSKRTEVLEQTKYFQNHLDRPESSGAKIAKTKISGSLRMPQGTELAATMHGERDVESRLFARNQDSGLTGYNKTTRGQDQGYSNEATLSNHSESQYWCPGPRCPSLYINDGTAKTDNAYKRSDRQRPEPIDLPRAEEAFSVPADEEQLLNTCLEINRMLAPTQHPIEQDEDRKRPYFEAQGSLQQHVADKSISEVLYGDPVLPDIPGAVIGMGPREPLESHSLTELYQDDNYHAGGNSDDYQGYETQDVSSIERRVAAELASMHTDFGTMGEYDSIADLNVEQLTCMSSIDAETTVSDDDDNHLKQFWRPHRLF